MTDFRGFTLIEATAVIVVIALLAGATVWSLAPPLGRARIDDALDRISYVDSLARRRASSSGEPMRLVFDLQGSAVSIQSEADRGTATRFALPPGHKFGQVQDLRTSARAGFAEIAVSPSGLSRTYAVQVVAGEHEQGWILIAGLSGQTQRVAGERQVEEVFDALR